MIWLKALLSIILGSILFWLLGKLWNNFLRWLSPLPFQADEQISIQTDDGWTLPLYRLQPTQERKGKNHPVVFCHGLGANRYNLHLGEERSLAKHLQNEGYDCWIVELRSASSPYVKPPKGESKYNFSIDQMIEHDLPTIIRTIKSKTGKNQLHWVGHSMGGIVMYCHPESSSKNSSIRSLTAIASPAHLSIKEHPLVYFGSILSLFPAVPTRFLSALIAPVAPWFEWVMAKIILPGNQSPKVTRLACLYLISDMSSRLLRHFIKIIKTGTLCNERGEPIYEQRLSQNTIPTFFLAGSKDGVASPESVRYAYERWKGEKRWQLFSKEEGTDDYAHGDILLGLTVPDFIYPAISKWLEEQDKVQERKV